jgi:hypothetical protein
MRGWGGRLFILAPADYPYIVAAVTFRIHAERDWRREGLETPATLPVKVQNARAASDLALCTGLRLTHLLGKHITWKRPGYTSQGL